MHVYVLAVTGPDGCPRQIVGVYADLPLDARKIDINQHAAAPLAGQWRSDQLSLNLRPLSMPLKTLTNLTIFPFLPRS